MTRFAIAALASLVAAGSAQAGLLIDFGTAPQQDTSNTFNYDFGNSTEAVSYDADNLIIESTYPGGFAVSGIGIGGDFSGAGSFIGETLPAELLSNPLQLEGSLTRTLGGSTFDAETNLFDFKVVFLPPGGGANLEYSFVFQADDRSGIDTPGGVTGVWTGDLTVGTPTPGFVVDQVQFILQVGDEIGDRGDVISTTLRVDNLQVVPEPTNAIALLTGLVAVAARRRSC